MSEKQVLEARLVYLIGEHTFNIQKRWGILAGHGVYGWWYYCYTSDPQYLGCTFEKAYEALSYIGAE